MAANEVDDLTPAAADYVASFRKAERPSATTASRSWSAIEASIAAAPVRPVATWRRPWVIVSAGLAAAAAIALLAQGFSSRTELARNDRPDAAPDVAATHPPQPSGVRERPTPAVLPPTPAMPPAAEPSGALPSDAPEVASPSDAPEGRPRPPRRERPTGTATLDDNALAEETRLWQAAQAALGSGDAEAALATVATWASRFPTGRFVDERTLLQARALCRAGRGEQAREVRERFLETRPDAPLASRMREVCREDLAP